MGFLRNFGLLGPIITGMLDLSNGSGQVGSYLAFCAPFLRSFILPSREGAMKAGKEGSPLRSGNSDKLAFFLDSAALVSGEGDPSKPLERTGMTRITTLWSWDTVSHINRCIFFLFVSMLMISSKGTY